MTLTELLDSSGKRLRLPFFACIGPGLLFSGCQQTATVTELEETAQKAVGVTASVSPQKPQRPKGLSVPHTNQLKVLLVSDPDTDPSAAALSVYRGVFTSLIRTRVSHIS